MVHPAVVAPFGVRARRTMAVIVLALALTLAVGLSGCGHRRAAMRPVFGTPVTTTTPVTVVPEAACPAGATMTTTPQSAEPFLNSTSISPGAAASGAGVIRAGGGSPPAADVAPEEPSLDAPEPNLTPIRPSATYKSTGTSGSIRPTGDSRSLGRQSSTSTRRARLSLREQVKPYVANPEDLFAPPKADRPWKYVVLHHSASSEGGYDQIDRDHRKLLGFDGCGYHFVIGNGTGSPDGQVEVADRWLNQKNGVHCPEWPEPGSQRVRDRDLPGRQPRPVADRPPRQVAAAQGPRGLPRPTATQMPCRPPPEVTTSSPIGPTACPGQ